MSVARRFSTIEKDIRCRQGRSEGIDVSMERIREDLSLLRLVVHIPAAEGQPASSLAASIQIERLSAVTARSRGFKAAILDSNGQPIFQQGAELAASQSFWAQQLKNSSKAAIGTALEFEENGVPMIGAYAPLADGALWATIQIPTSVVYLTARDLLSNLKVVALLLFALAAVASLIFARRLTRPLEQLTQAAEKVGKGEFEVRVKSRSRDEIGALSRSFNQMTDELSEREVEARRR